jgi:hypothetical protein
MTQGSKACAVALVFVLLAAWLAAGAAAAPLGSEADQSARAQAPALKATASALERAAAIGKIPALSIAPAATPALKTWLADGLRSARKEKTSAARRADLRALAASLRNGAELALRARVPAPKNVAADVRLVLAESAFHSDVKHGPAGNRQPSWLDRVVQMFFDWFTKLMARAFTAAAGAPAIGNIAAIVLITAAALALAFLIFRVTMLVVARQARMARSDVAGMPLAKHAGADETYDAACAAARTGSYGLAVALLFQAALLALDSSGRVPYDPARTAGEYRRAVRRSDAGAAGAFETLVRAFTYAAYAQSPAGERDWRDADAAYVSMSFTAVERR